MMRRNIHTTRRIAGRQRRAGKCQPRAFSMAELMVAVVILGLGLLMAATVFPVAWTRARDLAEATNSQTATASATQNIKSLVSVSAVDLINPSNGTITQLLGDIFVTAGSTIVNAGPPYPEIDKQVHPLFVENWLIDGVVGSNNEPVASEIQLEGTELPDSCSTAICIDQSLQGWFLTNPPLPNPVPIVSLGTRLVPPMTRWPGTDAPDEEKDAWKERFSSRRFAWTAFHKLESDIFTLDVDQSRLFTFYFVTLRRTQATHRFPRQDDYDTMLNTIAPRALGPAEDMAFAVPWLVNLTIFGTWDVNGDPLLDNAGNPISTGLPAEAIANPNLTDESRLTAQMLAPGSYLIDRINGEIYQVKQRNFTGTGNRYDYQATLTLDREIDISDVDDVNQNGQVDGIGLPGPDEDSRDFWVFPPPVNRVDSEDDEFPIFNGKQPVVAIETRQISIAP